MKRNRRDRVKSHCQAAQVLSRRRNVEVRNCYRHRCTVCNGQTLWIRRGYVRNRPAEQGRINLLIFIDFREQKFTKTYVTFPPNTDIENLAVVVTSRTIDNLRREFGIPGVVVRFTGQGAGLDFFTLRKWHPLVVAFLERHIIILGTLHLTKVYFAVVTILNEKKNLMSNRMLKM